MVDDDTAAMATVAAPEEATLFGSKRRDLVEVRTVRDGAGATIIVSWGDTRAEICYDIATHTVAICGDGSRPVAITVNGNRIRRG